jgi:hypothetical protein
MRVKDKFLVSVEAAGKATPFKNRSSRSPTSEGCRPAVLIAGIPLFGLSHRENARKPARAKFPGSESVSASKHLVLPTPAWRSGR